MRNNIKVIAVLASLCLLLAGCFESKETPGSDLPDKPGAAAKIFEEEGSSSVGMGMFSFGIVAPNADRQVYAYTGQDLHIPFKVTGLDKDRTSDFGLLVYVDGLPQPYSIEQKGGSGEETAIMHQFSLKNEETKEFELVFTPVAGKKGDRIGVVFAAILQPDYKSENASKPNYGIYHSLSATVPQEIVMQSDAPAAKPLQAYTKAEVVDIPQAAKDQAGVFVTDGSTDSLDESVTVGLVPEGADQSYISAVNGKAKFRFQIYGGVEATYHTTIYVNHKPVRINGSDYIVTKTPKGKMSTVEIELDTSSFEKWNTVYAVSAAAGRDYLTATDSPVKTKSMSLRNE
ncbi:hypothetical protein [Paenibacillus sp. MMS18-CY102]|uniref:hypothetical protein n=1 Tax=Paenibacillus sp. MMS18-CY102 TaxID=2682849 RepID=UPI001365465A|nr:hypothetical protein [Paenibacillus sp. MMS18-CY102]MWC29498.1 hypothetical protein [Paenibacillus sp. MMS18-CY102]